MVRRITGTCPAHAEEAAMNLRSSNRAKKRGTELVFLQRIMPLAPFEETGGYEYVIARALARSNLIFGGTGILPVILIDRLEPVPPMEIASLRSQ